MNRIIKAIISLLLTLALFSTPVVAAGHEVAASTATDGTVQKSSFNDVNETTPFYSDILKLESEGVVRGDGSGGFRPNDYVTIPEAFTMAARKYDDPDRLPDEWSDWVNFGKNRNVSWFDGSLIMGNYDCSTTTHYLAAHMIYRLKGLNNLPTVPTNLFEIPEGFRMDCEQHMEYVQLIIYGYKPLVKEHREVGSFMTRAEFCNMLVWAETLDGSLPYTKYEPPYSVYIEASGADANTERLLSYQIYSGLMSIPEYWLEEFDYQGGRVTYLSPDRFEISLWDMDLPAETAGYYTQDNRIVVQQTDRRLLLHEFAHFIYSQLKYRDVHEIDKQFWYETELDAIIDILEWDYAATNEREFFAEAFVCYYFHPDEMCEDAPIMYEIIDTVLTEYE